MPTRTVGLSLDPAYLLIRMRRNYLLFVIRVMHADAAAQISKSGLLDDSRESWNSGSDGDRLSHILFVLCTHICMLRVVQFKQIDVLGVIVVTSAGLEQMRTIEDNSFRE